MTQSRANFVKINVIQSKKYIVVVIFTILKLITSSVFGQSVPNEIPSLTYWFVADSIEDPSSGVGQWFNLASAGGSAAQPISGSRPAVNQRNLLNNHSVVSFDGVNDFLDVNQLLQFGHIYIVCNHNGTTFNQFNGLFTGQSLAAGNIVFAAQQSTTHLLTNGVFGSGFSINGVVSTNFAPLVDFKIIDGSNFTPLSLSSGRIGRERTATNRYWNGDIAEIIILQAKASSFEDQVIRDYLFEKYAPPVSFESDTIYRDDFCPFQLSVQDRFKAVEWSNGSGLTSITVSESGMYSVETIDVFNRISVDSVYVLFPGEFIQSFNLCSNSDSLWDTGLDPNLFTFEWQDGSTLPALVISGAGNYQVSIEDNQGCSFISEVVVISEDTFPTLDALTATNELCEGGVLSTVLPDPENLDFLWSTGSTGASTLVFTSGLVELAVVNPNGCVLHDDTDVFITGISPIVDFIAVYNCEALTIDFTDNSNSQDSGVLNSWSWNFGDVGMSGAQDTSFVFDAPGTYSVMLEVTTDNGCNGFNEQEVTVPSGVMSSLEIVNNCQGYETTITDQSDIIFDEVNSIVWTLFDPTNQFIASGIGTSIEFVPENEGFFKLERVVNTEAGCEEMLVDLIEISDPSFCYVPTENESLIFWLAADSLVSTTTNDAVVSWSNLANADFNAESMSTLRPALISDIELLNDHEAVRITSNTTWMDFGEVRDIRTVVVLLKHATGTQDNFPAFLGHPTRTDFVGNSGTGLFFSAASPFLLNGTGRQNGTNVSVAAMTKPVQYSILSFIPTDTLATQYFSKDRFVTNRGWLGDYVEFLFFSESLTNDEVVQVEQYLRYKYAPPVALPREIVVEYGFCDTALTAYKAFYTDYLWSTGSTDSIIHVNQSGIYSVTVTDIFGFTSTDSVKVVFPTDFIQNDFIVCAADTFIYDLDLNPIDYSFLWSTGAETPAIPIFEAGTFGVTVTDTLGCAFTTVPVEVIIDPFPETAAINDLPTFCLGNTLLLSSGAEEAETYLWSTGATTPLITPQASGTYWVEATNINGCVGRDTVEVDIAGIAPTAAYEVSAPCAATELQFVDVTDAQGSSVVAWNWDFGASTASTAEATATFPTAGAYPISLSVTLGNGCTGTLLDTLQVNHLPLVNFTAPIACAGSETFYESVSAVPGGVPITAWQWTFGNGSSDTGVVGSTTFAATGPNTVTLTVQSAEGCVATLTRNIEVLGSPAVDFSFTPACIGAPVLFTENVDISESGPVFYNWDFGNGFFSNFPNTSQVYAQPGVYNVTLTATGNNGGLSGCAAALTQQVSVFPPPQATATFEGACQGGVALLTDLTVPVTFGANTDAIATRQWLVEGVPSGNAAAQTYPANTTGTYTAALQITTVSGCTASATGTFSVLPAPIAAFDLELPIAAPPFTLVPTNLSVNAATSYWTMNGVFLGEGSSPELFFTEVGNYTIQLVASSGEGCNDTIVKGYFVVEPVFDLEIREVSTTETDSRLRVFTVLSNRGNVPIHGFDVDVQVGLSPNVFAKSDLTIPLGATVAYTLPLTFDLTSDLTMPYVCVEVSNPGGILDAGGSFTEIDLSNNRMCAGLERSGPVYVPPYPNPTSGDLNLGIILPEKGELRLEITDATGRRVRAFTLQMEKGYTLHTIPVYDFSEGLYLIRYDFDGDVKTVRFVVGR